MELNEIIAPLRKWWWLIVLATAVATLSSFLAVSQEPPMYQARTTLMIGRTIDNPNPSGNEFSLSQQLAPTYVDIAKREPVRDRTMKALGLQWLPEYVVRLLPNTQLIEIVVVDTIPERAQAVANELANQLILQSPTAPKPEEQERQAFINEQLVELENKIRETQEEIAAKQDEMEDLVSARQINELENQISGLQTKLTSLQTNYASLLSNTQRGAINTLTLIAPASLPRNPVGPNHLMNILTAALIGCALAVTAAYALEYLDNRIKTPDQVARLYNLPTLAGVMQIDTEGEEYELVTLKEPQTPLAEAFRILRTAILFSSTDSPSRKLLVTSPNPREGKSTLAANLAVAIAQAGYDVLLIDADLRRPVQHKIFDLSNERGLTSMLVLTAPKADPTGTDSQMEDFIQQTTIPGLSLLSSGPIPPNPSELLGLSRLRAALANFATTYEFVILDSPPCLVVTDPVVLSREMDGVLLVADAGTTQRHHLQRSIERLQDVGATLLGVVLNRMESHEAEYYYYGSYAGYYGEEQAEQAGQQDTTSPLGTGRATAWFRRWRRPWQAATDKD